MVSSYKVSMNSLAMNSKNWFYTRDIDRKTERMMG
jgi:hypothetical protein